MEYTRWSILGGVYSVEYTRWIVLGGVYLMEFTRWSSLGGVPPALRHIWGTLKQFARQGTEATDIGRYLQPHEAGGKKAQ